MNASCNKVPSHFPVGVILHFNQPILKDYYILNPQRWFDYCAIVVSPENVSKVVPRGAGMCPAKLSCMWACVQSCSLLWMCTVMFSAVGMCTVMFSAVGMGTVMFSAVGMRTSLGAVVQDVPM